MTNLTDIKSAFGQSDWDLATQLHTTVLAMVETGPTALTATWTEINQIADMSGQVVAPATGNLSLTAALHGNRVVYYDDADGVISLPIASGSGYVYKVVIKTQLTTGSIEALSAGATPFSR